MAVNLGIAKLCVCAGAGALIGGAAVHTVQKSKPRPRVARVVAKKPAPAPLMARAAEPAPAPLPCQPMMTPELAVRLPAAIYGIPSSDGPRVGAAVAGVPIMMALASEETSLTEDGRRFATEPSDVPEPAPAAMLALGLAALTWRMRRRAG